MLGRNDGERRPHQFLVAHQQHHQAEFARNPRLAVCGQRYPRRHQAHCVLHPLRIGHAAAHLDVAGRQVVHPRIALFSLEAEQRSAGVAAAIELDIPSAANHDGVAEAVERLGSLPGTCLAVTDREHPASADAGR